MPKAISLFSGAGGMDIGISQAGFDILACVEQDPFASDTLRTNIGLKRKNTKVYQADIRTIDPNQLLADLGLRVGELDLLFGGPPCQTFSQIGKRKSIEDPRGLLLFEMVRFAEVLKPKAILIENVKGLLTAIDNQNCSGGVFNLLISQLKGLGYNLKWQIVNSADYGVPQLRQRVFVVATKSQSPFQFPEPTHLKSDSTTLFGAKKYMTVGEVINDLRYPERYQTAQDTTDSHCDVTPNGDILRIQGVPEGGHLSAQEHLPIEQRGSLSKKDTTKFKRLSRTEPSNTLRCGEIFFHPTQDRYLTPREYMRIHGYPDSYVLKGPIRGRSGQAKFLDQHRQIANSVPPPVAKILGICLLETQRTAQRNV